jgi:hypothetical protein
VPTFITIIFLDLLDSVIHKYKYENINKIDYTIDFISYSTISVYALITDPIWAGLASQIILALIIWKGICSIQRIRLDNTPKGRRWILFSFINPFTLVFLRHILIFLNLDILAIYIAILPLMLIVEYTFHEKIIPH